MECSAGQASQLEHTSIRRSKPWIRIFLPTLLPTFLPSAASPLPPTHLSLLPLMSSSSYPSPPPPTYISSSQSCPPPPTHVPLLPLWPPPRTYIPSSQSCLPPLTLARFCFNITYVLISSFFFSIPSPTLP